MDKSKYISVEAFCSHHNVAVSFIRMLENRGMIQLIVYEEVRYLPLEYVHSLEKWVRLHQELQIHPEDLDVVEELLVRIRQLQEENMHLRQRLEFYKRLSLKED